MQSLIEDEKPTRMDVLHWIGRCTLDVIGRAGPSSLSAARSHCSSRPDRLLRAISAGFDYNFNALKQDHDELSDSFQEMFAYGSDINLLLILQSYIPFFKIFVRRRPRGRLER